MNTSFELTGILHKKYEEVEITDTFKKREFVIALESESKNWPSYTKFSLTNSYCSKIDAIEEGKTITVTFNVTGREWLNKETNEISYFNDLSAYRIIENEIPIQFIDTSGEADDLPF